MLRRTRPTSLVLAAVVTTALAITVTACGSDSDSSTSSSSSGSASAPADNSGVQAGEEAVATASKPPEFNGPTEKFPMSKAKGKTVWFISPVTVPFVTAIQAGVKEAAEAAGMKLVVFDGKGLVSEWNKGIDEAVSQGAAGIILQAIDPALVSKPVARAKAAGIPVIDAEVSDPKDPLPPGVVAHVTTDFSNGGKLLADYIASKSGGKANVGALYDSHFTVHKKILDAFTAELNKVCPDCKLTSQVADSAQIGTQGPTKTTNMLRRDPNMDWLVAIADYEAPWMIQGVKTAGRTGKVHVVGHDAVSDNLNLIRKDQGQEADAGIPLGWKGWAEIDSIGRAIAGSPQVDQNVPYRFFTKDNLPPASEALTGDVFGTTNYQEAYKGLWQ